MPITQLFAPMSSPWIVTCADVRLRLTTDQACRAYMWYSPNPPQRKLIYRPLRGVMVPCGYTFSFRPTAGYVQLEPGQTLLHSFDPFDWIGGTIGYHTFSFFLPTGLSKSQTPIIKSTRPPDPQNIPYWTGLICVSVGAPPLYTWVINNWYPPPASFLYFVTYATSLYTDVFGRNYPFFQWVVNDNVINQDYPTLSSQIFCTPRIISPGDKVGLRYTNFHSGSCWTEFGTA